MNDAPNLVTNLNTPTLDAIGKSSTKISVELSTRFLEHFSEQLYSSPQKAFEELISNGWDAGADHVDVRISADLNDPNATMRVFDNGASMDEEGLRQLWHIAFSPKEGKPLQYGRQVIGKFGIGKLATYVLANKLTYICKGSDGTIRRVTMDYGEIDRQKGFAPNRLISELELDLYEVTDEEVADALRMVHDGSAILDLIRNGIPRLKQQVIDDEYGGLKSAFQRPATDTWTLVVLSNLKPIGRELKVGILRRMLEAALPFGSEMAISLNGEMLASSKAELSVMEEWIIGPDLDIDHIELDEADGTSLSSMSGNGQQVKIEIPLRAGSKPVPHVELPGVGMVTGTVRLFVDRISGGKSDERGYSNGFHVNVLGRVVNQNDPSFGLDNLSHSSWAHFRMAVRADGLNRFLTTDREKFKERRELKIFRAFLRKVFNKARTAYDSDENAILPDGGDILVRSLGVISLNPLRNIVSETLSTQAPLPGLFDESGIRNREEKRQSWHEDTSENIKSAVGQVKYERLDDDSFVKFRISDNSIVVNTDHPFVTEHHRTKAEKLLVRTIAMVNLLTDIYALDIGIPPAELGNIREYRDQLMRFHAMQRRQSGTYIAKLLLQTQHDSGNSKRLEAVLSDTLRYLGYYVKDLAKSGEPEGLASAYAIPTFRKPTRENPNLPLYSLTFDAKSSKHDVASTGNINLAGVVEHRERFKANYALVVAPGFSEGALATRCEQQKVTPMMARDLGKLLEYTVEYGAIPVTKLREIFRFHDPNRLSQWVSDLEQWLKDQRPLTIDIFLMALNRLKGQVPDALSASTIAFVCRHDLKAYSVVDDDVIAVARGLTILIPDLVGIDGDKIIVNASVERVAVAVERQLENLHQDGSVGDRSTGEEE